MFYYIDNRRRINAVHAIDTINGIDYIEVRENQTTLHLYFVNNFADVPTALPPTRDQIIIFNPRERIPIDDVQPIGDNLVEITVARAGDESLYTLALIGADDEDVPPSGYDQVLSTIDFSFKVNCATNADCDDPDTPITEPDAPLLDYLAKDYSSFQQLMIDRLATTLPDWDANAAGSSADVMTALIETLAYSADHLSYYQDAVGTEAYLGTARQRESVRRHVRLLDYDLNEGTNARTWVTVQVSDGVTLPIGTHIVSHVLGVDAGITLFSDAYQQMLQVQPIAFQTMQACDCVPQHNAILPYTWGDNDATLPLGATSLSLRDDGIAPLDLAVGDIVLLVATAGVETGLPADADPTKRHAVRLTDVTTTNDAVFGVPVVMIEWAVEDALPFDLPLTSAEAGETPIASVYGNVVLADYGELLEETLPIVATEGRYRPMLEEPNLIFAARYEERDAVSALTPYGQGLPQVWLEDSSGHIWEVQTDLLASERFDRHFTVEVQSDRRTRLRFGDDTYGRLPAAGTQFVVRYRIGTGQQGNIGQNVLGHLLLEDGIMAQRIIAVDNPMQGFGGTPPETLESARRHAPHAFRTALRAVTPDDYALFASQHPAVQKAVGVRRWTGSWSTTFVIVDRVGGLPIDDDFKQTLLQHLEPYRLAGHALEIEEPEYIPIELAVTVTIKPNFIANDVRQQILRALGSGRLLDGTLAYFHPDNWTFGQPVYLSPLVARIMAIEGVSWVRFDEPRNRFQRADRPNPLAWEDGYIEMSRREIARLTTTPNFPDAGALEVYVRTDD